jgi:glycosyltransferase involved in cell wall biosynthesis
MKRGRKKLLILCPYPRGTAPSQRFRFEQYLDILEADGWEIQQEPFWDERSWEILYQTGQVWGKVWALFRGFWRRSTLLFRVRQVQVILVHRELAPMGFPWVAWFLSRVLKKPMIFDFDDAIWIPNTSHSNRWTLSLKSYGNTARLIRMSSLVFAGNAFLAEYARSCGGRADVQTMPTTIDTEGHHNRLGSPGKEHFVVGWTGSHSTLTYLDDLKPTMEALAAEFPLRWVVVSDVRPDFECPFLEFRPWTKETEVESLLDFHVGVMPLRADAWAEGKCGFKALQYLALGIPALVSPIGVNKEIVQHGKNGYLCTAPQEWLEQLKKLASNAELLAFLSKNTREGIVHKYSVLAHKERYIAALNRLAKH